MVIKPFGISQKSRIISLTWKNARFFQTPFYFSFIFLDNATHKFWDQSPTPHYQCCLRVSETVSWHKLQSCYCSSMLQHWIRERGLIYFCKVDHSRIFTNFSRNWLGLNNLSEILLVVSPTIMLLYLSMRVNYIHQCCVMCMSSRYGQRMKNLIKKFFVN